eukprot:s170_g4.t1
MAQEGPVPLLLVASNGNCALAKMAMLPVKALPLLGLLTWAHRATDVATLETESSASLAESCSAPLEKSTRRAINWSPGTGTAPAG